mgnify:CR=1 FL=1
MRIMSRLSGALGVLCVLTATKLGHAEAQSLQPDRQPVGAYDAEAAAPFEHSDSRRESVFAGAAGAEAWRGRALDVVEADVRLPGAYTLVVDAQGDVYVLEGVAPADGIAGAGVTKLDGRTLEVIWRAAIEPERRAWTYPGALALHGNGDLYVVTGLTAARIDRMSGEVLARRRLPDGGHPEDAAYNGLLLMDDGRILAKSFYRVPGCESDGFHAFLDCGSATELGSELALLEPVDLERVWSGAAPERIGGRITGVMRGGHERVYMPGAEGLHRWIYADDQLRPDPDWAVQDYTSGGERPGAAAAVFGDWVVIQTNARYTRAPYRIVALHQDDPSRRFDSQPFIDISPRESFIPSKPTADWANRRVYVVDAFGGTAALDFDPQSGFSTAWRAPSRSFNFTTLLGPAADRLLAQSRLEPGGADIARMRYAGDRIVLRDARTGEEIARSTRFPPGPGLTQLPGPGAVLYYVSISGELHRLSPGARLRD